MDSACRLVNLLYLPFRAHNLTKVVCLVLLFSAGMPIILPFFLLFLLTAVPCRATPGALPTPCTFPSVHCSSRAPCVWHRSPSTASTCSAATARRP